MQLLLDDNRTIFYSKRLPRYAKAVEEIEEDRAEIREDIKNAKNLKDRYNTRRAALENFIAEAQHRNAHIEKELYGLTPEDFERGWMRPWQ